MDISHYPLDEKNFKIGELSIQGNDVSLIDNLYHLKKKIGLLPDKSQLRHLNTINTSDFAIPEFSDEPTHELAAQVIGQTVNDFYDFIENYKKYLSQKLETVIEGSPFNESAPEKHKYKPELITLKSTLTEDQLKGLHEKLISQKYISEIMFEDFKYFLSGAQIKNVKKINWIKPKGLAIHLFENISYNFSMTVLNNCAEKKGKKVFDSKDKTKVVQEIDVILNDLKKNNSTL
jgi:hypothetical protein